MDADATGSYADGKIKAELGDDPDRSGTYSFGFTIHNLEDTATAFRLSADFFTQALSLIHISMCIRDRNYFGHQLSKFHVACYALYLFPHE